MFTKYHIYANFNMANPFRYNPVFFVGEGGGGRGGGGH